MKIKGTISLEWLRPQQFSVYFLHCVFLLKQSWWFLFVCPQSGWWGCGGGGTVLRSLGGSRSLSGMEWYAKAAFLIYSVSILHDMQNKLWREGGKKVSFEWPCRLEGLIFSPSLLKILDMQMDVTVIPCHSLAGWLAGGPHTFSPSSTVRAPFVSGQRECIRKWRKCFVSTAMDKEVKHSWSQLAKTEEQEVCQM